MVRTFPVTIFPKCVLACLLLMAIFTWSTDIMALNKVTCSDGDHYLIDAKDISIKYGSTQIMATLNGLAVLQIRLNIDHKTLLLPAEATQKINEIIKALVAGYNTCAITKKQYHEAVVYLMSMKSDAASLEQYRKDVLDNKKISNEKITNHLKSFERNMRGFVKNSGKEIDYIRLASIVDEEIQKQTQELREEMRNQRAAQADFNVNITKRIEKLEQEEPYRQLTPPEQIKVQLSSSTKDLSTADVLASVTDYEKGHTLMDQYKFRDAIPYFKGAMSAVKLSDFTYALGSAYLASSDLNSAQKVLLEGLNNISSKALDTEENARLKNITAYVLQNKGDLSGALQLSQQALGIDTKIYGEVHPIVATDMKTLGGILQSQGDINGSIDFTKKALGIDTKIYGEVHPIVATDMKTLGQIYQSQGNLTGALDLSKQALGIDIKIYGVKIYGEVHPIVATDLKPLGQFYQSQGNLPWAATTATPALGIDTKIYGKVHPIVATDLNNIGQILKTNGNLTGALDYTKQSLNIVESSKNVDDSFTNLVKKNLEEIQKALKN